MNAMLAWQVTRPAPIATGPLTRADLPEPTPGPAEIRVRVRACGVCRTDLHLAEGDLPPYRRAVFLQWRSGELTPVFTAQAPAAGDGARRAEVRGATR